MVNPTKEGTINLKVMLCGDVMCGRGIDQILPYQSSTLLYEPWIRDAREYIRIAEEANGPIPRKVNFNYVWGDSFEEMARLSPHLRIINLETSITVSNSYWPSKGINYRMHPANVAFLQAANIDCCALANNHVLDYDRDGLSETLETLHIQGIRFAGAGFSLQEAISPAILATEQARVLFYSFGFESSGIPSQWAATDNSSGVAFFTKPDDTALEIIRQQVKKDKQNGDIVIISLHWGDNWDYSVYPEERTFAHKLIDIAGADIVHGHSSHHIKGIEVHNERLILYGCGDLINDYEGIGGNDIFRGDLSLLYFATVNSRNGTLAQLDMVPFSLKKFRLQRVTEEDFLTVSQILDREGQPLGTKCEVADLNTLSLKW